MRPRLLPGMVGGDGTKRKYLLLIMNNAEVRSLAGMPGSFSVITAQGGKLKMGKQGGILDVRTAVQATPRGEAHQGREAPVPEHDRSRHPGHGHPSRTSREPLSSPPPSRQAVEADVRRRHRGRPRDAGLHAQRHRIRSTSATAMTLNSQNAVQQLLNGVYFKYPIDLLKQDAVFENAARRIFDATVAGPGNCVAVIRALVRGVSERRLMLWSRHADEQKRILTTGISNTFQGTGRTPAGRGLRQRQRLGQDDVLPGHGHHGALRAVLRRIRPGAARRPRRSRPTRRRTSKQLPLSIIGFGPLATPIGATSSFGVMIAGPKGGTIESMTVDGQPAPHRRAIIKAGRWPRWRGSCRPARARSS